MITVKLADLRGELARTFKIARVPATLLIWKGRYFIYSHTNIDEVVFNYREVRSQKLKKLAPVDENEIKKACRKMIKQGWSIEPRLYRKEDTKKCCPLSALATVRGVPRNKFFCAGLLAEELSLTREQVNSFTAAFDGDEDYQAVDANFKALGTTIRQWWLESMDK